MEQSHCVHPKDNVSAAVTSDIEQCLNAFDRHLRSERGCASGTRANYLREARSFLVFVFPDLRTNREGLNAASHHPTICWPSSRHSDNAERRGVRPLLRRCTPTFLGIIRNSA